MKLLLDDEIPNFKENFLDNVLLLNREEKENSVKIMTPAQSKQSIAWHKVPDLEEFFFPNIFGGTN